MALTLIIQKLDGGELCTISADATSTIDDIKRLIQNETEVHPSMQNLVIGAKSLKPSTRTLSEFMSEIGESNWASGVLALSLIITLIPHGEFKSCSRQREGCLRELKLKLHEDGRAEYEDNNINFGFEGSDYLKGSGTYEMVGTDDFVLKFNKGYLAGTEEAGRITGDAPGRIITFKSDTIMEEPLPKF